jgi:hypothetical protein
MCNTTSHLAQMWQHNSKLIPVHGMMRHVLSQSILWQGDPFSSSELSVLGCSGIHGWMGQT